MSFSPVYKSFQHLLAENNGIFKLFKKTKNPGMYQAVWQARQAEVDTYKERLHISEHKLSQIHECYQLENKELKRSLKDTEAKLIGKTQTADNLKDQVLLASNELEKVGLQLIEKSQSQETYRIQSEANLRELQALKREIELVKQERSQLKQELQMAHSALLKINTQYEETKSHCDELTVENEGLNISLEKSQHYAKEFRRINSRMENELHRVHHELERLQSLN